MVSFFFFHTPFFDCGAIFRGDTQPLEKKPIRFTDAKFYAESFEQKKYLKTITIPEACKDPGNWWYVLVPFEIFVQILGTVKHSSIKRFENSIRFKFHLSTYCYMYPTFKISEKNACLKSCCWWTSFGNFIYTTIVCKDNPLWWSISNFKSFS